MALLRTVLGIRSAYFQSEHRKLLWVLTSPVVADAFRKIRL